MSEYRPKVLRINSGIVATSFFKVQIPSTSQCIRFGTKLTRAEMNDEVELRQEFRLSRLAMVKEFGCRKVFEVLVVHDDINRCCGALKVMVPDLECFVDSE